MFGCNGLRTEQVGWSVNVAPDAQSIAVHGTGFFHGKGPVFFASTPCEQQTSRGRAIAGIDDKLRLATILWDYVASKEGYWGIDTQSANQGLLPVSVVAGLLGKPRLMRGAEQGPAISFSTCGGDLWAALSGDASDIGIDLAGSDEFRAAYPYLRVFRPEEMHHALRLTKGDLEGASALLWSIKEAVVKALGCAFHLVEPRHVFVYPSVDGSGGGYTFAVGLSGKAQEHYPLIACRPLWVQSMPQQKQWCSIALVDRKATDHV